MTSKEKFLEEIDDILITPNIKLSEEAEAYLSTLRETSKERPRITDMGIAILHYLVKTDKASNAKKIGEMIGFSGRSVSGAMQKLIKEKFVEKIAGEPITYKATAQGVDFINSAENK